MAAFECSNTYGILWLVDSDNNEENATLRDSVLIKK